MSSPVSSCCMQKSWIGGSYPFCQMDDITLKTIIRSNPGLLLIKDGTILNKWSDGNLPDEYVLSGRLEDLPLGLQKPVNRLETMGYVMLWFLVPLMLVIGVDILIVRRRERRHAARKLAASKASQAEQTASTQSADTSHTEN